MLIRGPTKKMALPIAGISETERKRRKESNLFTTKINFTAWLLEVLNIARIANAVQCHS